MNVQIRWRHATRSQAVEEHLARRLRFALRRFAPRVTAVRVWLEDVNGPRGGLDKRCAIELHGALGYHRAEAYDDEFRIAIDRAARAAARSLASAAESQRDGYLPTAAS